MSWLVELNLSYEEGNLDGRVSGDTEDHSSAQE